MRTPGLILFLASTILATSCSRKAPEREWSPSDHDRLDENSPTATAGVNNRPPDRAAGSQPSPNASAAGVDGFWQSSCAQCHGSIGKGDGPSGAMLRVPDLTSPQVQNRISDEEVATTILKGRGQMPAFNLPPPAIQALVKKVRSFKQ